ncbi:class I SAM-dependent methyltransferase [Candidatus Fermentibacteria bacterium]|nr:class I SAM-dependent methyltransferase [Candidatus Fermentibacteria bacterium]
MAPSRLAVMVRRRVTRDPGEDWDSFYRRYQKELATQYLIPLLTRWGLDLHNGRVLEVGCGDGGCGAAFAAAGCRVTMIDIDRRLVEVARRHNENEGIDARVVVGDVTEEDADVFRDGPFDLVMFRDVIEHLDKPARALGMVRHALSGQGLVFVIFPPYYSPFGAHQQILPRKRVLWVPYNRLPYLQLLPDAAFHRLTGGSTLAHEEVRRLRQIRLTIHAFHRCIRDAGFVVAREKMYLSRPSFALRYGAPVLGAPVIGRIPLVRELAITAAYCLLAPAGMAESLPRSTAATHHR